MKRYYIEVTETLRRIVAVEAEDLEEAYEKVEEWADEGEGLTYEDFAGRDFEDRTQYAEYRESNIREAFYDITPRDYKTLFEKVKEDIAEIYQENPTIAYDEALQIMAKKEYFSYRIASILNYSYCNGWNGPVLLIRNIEKAEIELYIAVNKHNKIQVVHNMLEVK